MTTPNTIIRRNLTQSPQTRTLLANDGGANDGKGVEATGTSDGAQNVNVVNAAFGGFSLSPGGIVTWSEGAISNPATFTYGSWAEAHAVASLVKPSTIAADPDAPGVIPAGSWNVDRIRIFGGDGAIASIGLAAGAELIGPAFYFENVTLNPEGTFIDLTGTDQGFLTLIQTGISSGSAVAISLADTAVLNVSLRYFSFLYGADRPVLFVDTGAQASVFTDIATGVYENTLDGDGDILVDDLTGIAVLNRNPAISHTQLGTAIVYAYG